MAAYGASCPFPCFPAKVPSPNDQQMLRGEQDEKPYCLTEECYRPTGRCLIQNVPVASPLDLGLCFPLFNAN